MHFGLQVQISRKGLKFESDRNYLPDDRSLKISLMTLPEKKSSSDKTMLHLYKPILHSPPFIICLKIPSAVKKFSVSK